MLGYTLGTLYMRHRLWLLQVLLLMMLLMLKHLLLEHLVLLLPHHLLLLLLHLWRRSLCLSRALGLASNKLLRTLTLTLPLHLNLYLWLLGAFIRHVLGKMTWTQY